MSTYEVMGGYAQVSTQRGYRQFNFSPDMRRFFFAMVFTPSRGYMNPTVISISVGARSEICGKLASRVRKRQPVEN